MYFCVHDPADNSTRVIFFIYIFIHQVMVASRKK